jgi:calcineurin-like phosphoesterase family protein
MSNILRISGGYATSDPHYYHKNILKYQAETRQYADEVAMNEALISRHNAKVGPNDHVWFLGDFSFGNLERTVYVLQRLHGVKHLILGNHDELIIKNMAIFREHFASIDTYRELKFKDSDGDDHLMCLFHYPIYEWNRGHHGSFMLHGHSHGNCRYPWPNQRRIMDVGVDCHPNNEPFSFEEIAQALKKRPVIKHH